MVLNIHQCLGGDEERGDGEGDEGATTYRGGTGKGMRAPLAVVSRWSPESPQLPPGRRGASVCALGFTGWARADSWGT